MTQRQRVAAMAVLVLILIILLLTFCAPQAKAHDALAWNDPERDDWFRSLKTPPESGSSMSCCDFRDGFQVEAKQSGVTWFVLIDAGWVPVPPERVVLTPVSIDGEAYLFRMPRGVEGNPHGIRCFIPPVGMY